MQYGALALYIAGCPWPGTKSDGPLFVGAGASVLLEGTNVGALFGVGELGTRMLVAMRAAGGARLAGQPVETIVGLLDGRAIGLDDPGAVAVGV